MSHYAGYFAIEKSIKTKGFDVNRHELVDVFTKGKTQSLKDLSDREYAAFCAWLNQKFELKKEHNNQDPVSNQMRRKVWALFVKKMHYTPSGLENWMLKYSIMHKPLNSYTKQELVRLVTQAEAVYDSYLKEINKLKEGGK